MAYDGVLNFSTAINTAGFQKDANKLGGIVKGLGVFKIIEKGFQAVTSSIDGAVSRYDTLNRFPKVLENMGFSAEQSAAATQKLSDGVQGLPTSLDEIVSTAQRLTVLTGNLEDSTDTALALNNAFYASGATAADASRGFIQYTQMLSKGKVDLISWRTLQETMGYALSKTAEAFGFAGQAAQNDLYAALLDGEITFSEFNAKIIELNAGVGGFAEMAKTSTGGIATAWKNFSTAIVRGTTSIIEAVDNGFSATRFKSIENIIVSTGKGINTALQSAAAVVEMFVSNLDTLAIAAIGVGTAFGVYKAIQAWNTAAQNAKKISDLLKVSNQQLAIAVTKSSESSLALAASTTKQAAAEATATAEVLRAKSIKLQQIAEETKLTAAKTAETAATIKGAFAQVARAEADQTAFVAKNAEATATTAATAADTAEATATRLATIAQNEQNVSVGFGTALIGYLTGSLTLHQLASAAATVATNLFSMALKALPLIGIIAAVGALVMGIIALVKWIATSDKAYQDGKKYIEDYGEANDALADSLDESSFKFDENKIAAEANANTSREMLSGLQALASKGLDRTAQETYQLQAKLNTLNSVQQGLNLTIDETTSALSMTAEEVDAYISATESAARATALEDHMKALSEQMVEVESQFIDAERQITMWEQQVESGKLSTAKYDKLVADLNAEMVELKTTQAGIVQEMAQNEAEYTQVLARQEQERQALIALQEDEIRAFAAQHHLSYEEIRADMDKNNLSFVGWQEENQKVLDKSQEAVVEFADKWGYSLDDVNTAITASGLTIEEYVDRQDEALEHSKEVLAEYTASVTSGFSTMEQESAISLNKFTENMKKNEEATANWAANMNTLMDLGINQGVIEQLSKMGLEGAAQAQTFVDELTQMNGGVELALGNTNTAVAIKLAEIDATFDTSLETASAAADAQLRAESYYTAGYASIDKIASGIAENPAATNAAKQSGTDIAQSITTAVETVDFASTGQAIGNSMVSGLTSAVSGGVGKITSAATSMSTSVQNVFKTMSTQSQNTVTQMMTAINSTIVSRTGTIRASITGMGNSITTALNTAKIQVVNITTQMMTSINSAIVSRASTVKASMTSCANGVVTALTEMKTKSGTLAEQTMIGINSAIVSRTGTIKSSTVAVSKGIVDSLQPMIKGAAAVAGSMMDGIGTAMDNKAGSLYKKAREIARRIAATMEDALDVHSPSRVMIRLFENVMMGIYEGMDGMSGMLYREAENIAGGLAERLTISPDVANTLAEQLRGITEANPLGGVTLTPQSAYAGAGGGTMYSTHLTQNITTPKPLSPSEMTREGQDLLRRQRWQLP